MTKPSNLAHLLLSALCLSLLLWLLAPRLVPPLKASANAPEPTPDGMENPASSERLAEPPLTESPTQYEQGRYDYWMHCMPCHGDYGQGLTQEFIELWPPDHQGCWGRGCHGGRIEDEGFPIPKTIPAVIYSSGEMLRYTNPEDLFGYLKNTHPPQNPGILEEDTYWAITAFVLAESDQISIDEGIGPEAGSEVEGWIVPISAGLFALTAVLLVWVQGKRKSAAPPNPAE